MKTFRKNVWQSSSQIKTFAFKTGSLVSSSSKNVLLVSFCIVVCDWCGDLFGVCIQSCSE